MNTLLYFIGWALLIFLMMRMGCGRHIMGSGHADGGAGQGPRDGPDALRWIPPERDTDPVCGKSVWTGTAKPSVHDGYVYYFCSRECREIFEAAPEQYVGNPLSGEGAKALEHTNERL